MSPRAKSLDPTTLTEADVDVLTKEGRRIQMQGEVTYADGSPFTWPSDADTLVVEAEVVVNRPAPGSTRRKLTQLLWSPGTEVTRAQYEATIPADA